ncbi:hypothetical protein ACVWXM_009641 [Bradyrhizobium sp. GM7.3]
MSPQQSQLGPDAPAGTAVAAAAKLNAVKNVLFAGSEAHAGG